jgi:branched-chain amino acid transport system substrate-binding protein
MAAAAVLTVTPALAAGAPDSIRVGYSVSMTGINAQGGLSSTLPEYRLWVHDVNAAGGIYVKQYGKKLPVKAIEYDDASDPQKLMQLTERLIVQDKVDFLLPPYSTAFNLLVAPLYARYGYPEITGTANANEEAVLVKKFPTLFFMDNQSYFGGMALVELLNKYKDKLNGKIAMLSVGDQFGAEMSGGTLPALEKAGFKVVLNKSYPLGTQDLSAEIKEARDSGADVLLAFSYPADSFMITGDSINLGYSPKIFFDGVGPLFPEYKKQFGPKAEGVTGLGGWNPNAPGAQAYLKRHIAIEHREPDRGASPIVYASLQILQQAIEKAGTLDRRKVTQEIADGGPYTTIVGQVDLRTHIRGKQFWIGQWQHGEFVGISPLDVPGAKPMEFPKPAW